MNSNANRCSQSSHFYFLQLFFCILKQSLSGGRQFSLLMFLVDMSIYIVFWPYIAIWTIALKKIKIEIRDYNCAKNSKSINSKQKNLYYSFERIRKIKIRHFGRLATFDNYRLCVVIPDEIFVFYSATWNAVMIQCVRLLIECKNKLYIGYFNFDLSFNYNDKVRSDLLFFSSQVDDKTLKHGRKKREKREIMIFF